MAERTVVLGRGPLAFAIAARLHTTGAELAAIVTLEEEPRWEARLTDLVRRTPLENVPILRSHEELQGDFTQAWSAFYDRILPKELLDRIELPLNIHPGPLPKYRGVRPINWALKNGENHHGVTIHRMDEGIDSGPIYGQVIFPIWPEVDEVRDVYDRMLSCAMALFGWVHEKLPWIEPYEQDHLQATINYSMDNDKLGDRWSWNRKMAMA